MAFNEFRCYIIEGKRGIMVERGREKWGRGVEKRGKGVMLEI